MKERREYEKRARIRLIRRVIRWTLSAAAVIGIGLGNLFCPYFSQLPAYGLPLGEGGLRVHFIDVGQGDCTAVEFPDGSLLLIDAGDGSWQHNAAVIRYLNGLGTEHLTLLLTHADKDHYGGLSAVIQAFGAERLYLPALSTDAEEYLGLLSEARERGIPMERAARFTAMEAGGAYVTCLSPHLQLDAGLEENDASTVLWCSYAGVNILLCADLSSRVEDSLIREDNLSEQIGESVLGGQYPVYLRDTDILHVGHHGSASGTSAGWLERLSPQIAVITCGRGNQYGHPAQDLLYRLGEASCSIYRTDELGHLLLSVSPDGTYRMEYGYT